MRPDGNKVIWQSAWETHTNIKQLSTSNYGLDWIRQQWRQGKLTRLKMVMHIRWLVKWNNWRIGGSESVRHAVEWVMGTCSHAHGTVGGLQFRSTGTCPHLSHYETLKARLCCLHVSIMFPSGSELGCISKLWSFHNPWDRERYAVRWFSLV